MGEKEIFFLFLLSFCLITFGMQPKATSHSSTFAASGDAISVSYNQ